MCTTYVVLVFGLLGSPLVFEWLKILLCAVHAILYIILSCLGTRYALGYWQWWVKYRVLVVRAVAFASVVVWFALWRGLPTFPKNRQTTPQAGIDVVFTYRHSILCCSAGTEASSSQLVSRLFCLSPRLSLRDTLVSGGCYVTCCSVGVCRLRWI